MRVRIGEQWIAGHPEFQPASWSPAEDINFVGLHEVIPQTGAGFVARSFFDGGNRGVVVRFTTTRLFGGEMEAAAFMYSLFSAEPPHALTGDVFFREDTRLEYTEHKLFEAVVSVTGVTPVGALSLRVHYQVSGGLFGFYRGGGFCLLLNDDNTWLLNDDGSPLLLDQCEVIEAPVEPPYGYYWTP
jgi:hypothetical protein